jgi:serine/threonine protein kinase/tetratricopeptide (TPR) repeat protein
MAAVAAERDMLFGLLALQNGLINQVQLVAAFQAWTLDKARVLADHLVARGDLDADDRSAVEALVARHLKKHGGDVERSLAAIPAGRSTRESLARIADPDLGGTLARLGSAATQHTWDADRTASYSVGEATSEGQRFRILRPHAQGGLGAVFVAMDSELHREVALKQILDSHADDPASRQRFLLEAEVTGGLEHPGIVPVYGLGTHGDGRPFYAMRFIRGDSLKEAIEHFHADDSLKSDAGRRSLELRKLLHRFTDVCNAIAYAHSRGVLHRDIKPGNIIVGRHGETLVVDWGLAKATGKTELGAEERTLMPSSASGSAETLPGSALGTPAYMSPEQARGESESLGPRSDVYSLGATLYCLLTGRPPLEGDDVGEVLRRVQRSDFPPPRQIDGSIDAALEAVCLKAMASKREDRHDSCRALAEDIDRWMADEPVTAWREPLSRRARRWRKRHRTAVAAALVALVAGVIGLGSVAGVQARANIQLRNAKTAIEQALAATRQAQAETQAALRQSEDSRQQAEAVSKFLVGAFRSPDPSQDGRLVKVADIVDRASERLDKELDRSPAVRGTLLDALGRTYWGLGLYDRSISLHTKARAVREAALGPGHPNTLMSCANLALAYQWAGRYPEAISLYEETLKGREAALGLNDVDTLSSRQNLAIAYAMVGRYLEAIPVFEAALKVYENVHPDHPDRLRTRHNLAGAYQLVGRTSDAIALYESTLKLLEARLGADHISTLRCRSDLATAYQLAGRLPEAIALHERTLVQWEAKSGPEHPDTLRNRASLASAYFDAGRRSEALALSEAILKLQEFKLGHDHPETLTTRNDVANFQFHAGRLSEALALYEATFRQREAVLGPDHPETLESRNNLGLGYYAAGRLAAAATLHEVTVKLLETKLGPEHPSTLKGLAVLGKIYESLGRRSEAEDLYRRTLAGRRKASNPDNPDLADDLTALGHALMEQARWTEAEPLLREGLAIREKMTPDHWRRYEAMSLLGAALLGQARQAEAEPLIVSGYEGLKARGSGISMSERSRLPEAAERVIRLYERWNKPDQATAWKAKLGMPDLPADVFARP